LPLSPMLLPKSMASRNPSRRRIPHRSDPARALHPRCDDVHGDAARCTRGGGVGERRRCCRFSHARC
jgi:hypothetical protein